MTINSICYACEEIARQMLNMKAPTNCNAHCMDGYNDKGETLEVKCLFNSRPSLGGKYVLENTTNIKTAIEAYCTATFYVFFIEENKPLIMDKQTAVEWLVKHVVLDKMSSKRGGHYKLKIAKNERTQKQTQEIIAAGFTL